MASRRSESGAGSFQGGHAFQRMDWFANREATPFPGPAIGCPVCRAYRPSGCRAKSPKVSRRLDPAGVTASRTASIARPRFLSASIVAPHALNAPPTPGLSAAEPTSPRSGHASAPLRASPKPGAQPSGSADWPAVEPHRAARQTHSQIQMFPFRPARPIRYR